VTEIKNGHLKRAKRIVRDKFPEMAGVEPSLAKKRSHSKGGRSRSGASAGSGGAGHYVLTFEKDVSLPGGRRLKRLVRVTMNESGEVLKLTSSK
jgi:hypothetical protein